MLPELCKLSLLLFGFFSHFSYTDTVSQTLFDRLQSRINGSSLCPFVLVLLDKLDLELNLIKIGSDLVDVSCNNLLRLSKVDVEVSLQLVDFSHKQVHHIRHGYFDSFKLVLITLPIDSLSVCAYVASKFLHESRSTSTALWSAPI